MGAVRGLEWALVASFLLFYTPASRPARVFPKYGKIIAIRDWFPLCTFCSFFFLDCNAHVIIQYIGGINVGHESREISWSCAMTNTMMIDCLHSSQRAVHGTRRLANLKVRERHSPLHASRGSGRTEAPFGRRGTLATRNHHVRSRLPRRCANRLRSLPPRSQAR